MKKMINKIIFVSIVLTFTATIGMLPEADMQKQKQQIGTIETLMKKLHRHLIYCKSSDETANQIREILSYLKKMREKTLPNEFRSTLEKHYDEITAAAFTGSEYYKLSCHRFDPNEYVMNAGNAKANEIKINRFCEYLSKEYDVFKGGVPLLEDK
jgi:hypothetical protein